jgi:NADH-quinone oxidoreductase subunit G
LADALGVSVGFDSFDALRDAMVAEVPALGFEGCRLRRAAQGRHEGQGGRQDRYPIKDFYLTNPIARSSPTMQRCSAELLHGEDWAEAAE